MLEKIHSSDDIKQLNTEELPALCKEIRAFLIRTVSETGGHLASNLGTVELTVALHRVYDSKRDRIVFDVGHQSYTHKIITGRRDKLHTLRQFGGISGFPKPYEAEDDAFIAGHASNSVSVALGMAHARTLSGDDYDICAVIGDGAMTGGLSFEGLSNAAMSGEPLVVILNDNNMSIAENVGGAARLLQSMRVKPAYLNFKRHYR
ncbi:MAG TPA: 1-deoxy-D-xylulose-5-phosphate synthase, partial [Clostridiales bacterium]|nr:1-deoxy-D-xylulose-5-phosphate synthase [Clostridiales bacterium]